MCHIFFATDSSEKLFLNPTNPFFSVTYGCGSQSSENCTYFESATTPSNGPCSFKVCKQNANICQLRLDFNSFVITGPSTITLTTPAGKFVGQIFNTGGGVGASVDMTRCLTDTFSVSNQNQLPVICGTNTGYHAYFEASDACNSLDFILGTQTLGATAATRAWSIKITQYSCDYENLAPSGCVNWHFGSTVNFVYSYNWAGQTVHLADQRQTICVRREAGYCRYD